MKRLIYFIIFMIVMGISLVLYINTSEQKSDFIDDVDFDVVGNNSGNKMAGYYYYGYLDEREKFNDELEEDYFYYMDNHFEEYQNSRFIFIRDEQEVDEEIIEFFQSIDGLNLFEIPFPGYGIKNGDYISFHVKSPIKESYPAKIDKIADVEVLYKRENK